MRPKVYLSGPITRGDREHNFRQAAKAQYALMAAGCAVHNPMLTMRLDYAWDVPHDVWVQNDLPFIADGRGHHSDAVLRLPGQSEGADVECAHAALHGVPVRHTVQEIIDLLEPESTLWTEQEEQ